MKVKVFGRNFEVQRESDQWLLFAIGDGKKRPVNDILIPGHLSEEEVVTFLADMFHELATPENSEVKRID